MDALEEIQFDPAGKTALILGAGGAAKAAAFVLKWLKADKIFVASRSEAKARQVAVRASGEFLLLDTLLEHDIPTNILINATTASSREESKELADIAEKLQLPKCELIFDLNYGRSQNFWQIKADKNGIKFRDGLLTLIHQAKNSLSLWTGLDIETDAFRKALENAV
jgi:shikimate dehydrogenase